MIEIQLIKKKFPENMISNVKESALSTAMKFKVSGDLCIDLELEMGEQIVILKVSETGLSIEMDGGLKFTIPNQVKAGHKKAG